MGRNLTSAYVRPHGYYSRQLSKDNDKYDGMLSKKQLADLEGATSLKVTKISKSEVTAMIDSQKQCGVNMHSPNDFNIT